MEYGCIGEKLSHSFSKEIHQQIADYSYELCELRHEEVAVFLKARNFHAINITIPYKETVLPYLDEIDESAEAIGAVNTIVNRNGRLCGYNTDFYGLKELFSHVGISPMGKKIAILGTGGTAKTARAVVRALGGGEILTVSRTPEENEIGYEELKQEHSDIDILINTTPVGMYPNVDSVPIALDVFPSLTAVLDAVYHPLRTNLVFEAKMRGILAVGGLYMLVSQAVRASELFCNVTYPQGTTERIYQEILSKKENIVLIGMPSSGKSTVGALLSEKLSRPFLDTDEVFTQRYGLTPAEYIRTHTEEDFREKETVICCEVSKQTGHVIACGGGVILREESIRALSRGGKVIFLDRPLDALTPTADRPLTSNREALAVRYCERLPLYHRYADLTIDASHTIKEVVRLILDRIQ